MLALENKDAANPDCSSQCFTTAWLLILISRDLCSTVFRLELARKSCASVGSHVGYIPASALHRKDILVAVDGHEQVVSVEAVESPGND